MSEKDVIFSKINIIKNCITAIEKVKASSLEEAFRVGLFELNLQRAIQASVDLANVVIAKEGLGLPNSYRQSFEILATHAMIDGTLLKVLSSMVGFRNISVHDYGTIKPEIVKSIVDNHLLDFEKFYSLIYQHVMTTWK